MQHSTPQTNYKTYPYIYNSLGIFSNMEPNIHMKLIICIE